MYQSGWGGAGRQVSEGMIATYATVKEGNLESHTWGPLLLSCISIMQDGNNLDRAVFDVDQILADLDHKMSKSQRDLGFGHFVDPFFLINSFGGFIGKFYTPLSKCISFLWLIICGNL